MSSYRTFRLNKLVRDKIIELTQSYGGDVQAKTLSGEELNLALIEKFIEEARELKDSSVSAAELADLQEILDCLAQNLNINREEIEKIQHKKRARNGGFSKGYFIETLRAPTDSEWADYYGADPQKYPEIKEGRE